MHKSDLAPVSMHFSNALGRAHVPPYTLTATDIMTLARQSMELSKLVATEKRDLEAIRNHHTQRLQELANEHDQMMALIENEYKSRTLQTELIHEQARRLIDAEQFEIAERIIERLSQILAISPLEKVIKHRK